MRAAFALRIDSGKKIYNFGIAERLRALRYPFFTGGVVEGNGSCRAGFLRKHPRGGGMLLPDASGLNPLSHRCAMPAPPKGELFLRR